MIYLSSLTLVDDVEMMKLLLLYSALNHACIFGQKAHPANVLPVYKHKWEYNKTQKQPENITCSSYNNKLHVQKLNPCIGIIIQKTAKY